MIIQSYLKEDLTNDYKICYMQAIKHNKLIEPLLYKNPENYNKYFIHLFEVNNSNAYSDYIKYCWQLDDDLIIIEHDILYSEWHLKSIIESKAKLATARYLLYYENQTYPPYYAHRVIIDNTLRNATCQDNFCDYYGFGFTKISKDVKKLIDISKIEDFTGWQCLDSVLSRETVKLNIRCEVLPFEVYHLHYHTVPESFYQ